MEQNTYEITKGFDTRIRLWGKIAIRSILIWFAFIYVGHLTATFLVLNDRLWMLSIIFHAVIGFLLITSRPSHPDTPTYKVILSILGKDNNKYKSLDYNKYTNLKKEG